MPCPKVPAGKKVVDTTGAGDSLIGALATVLAADGSGKIPLEKAVATACEVATISVQDKGAQPSYPDKNDPRVIEIMKTFGSSNL